uniref:guanylate-binding protein 1-like n=1 Tax=Pristiophorus japonicus TaxID=55135 RepID=UPI00398F6C1B
MDAPVCLVDNTSDGSLIVKQDALNILASLRKPVAVVSIAGKYRTGKSYLMNRLAGKSVGFSLGSTIQSHTKGIWMWCVEHPCNSDQHLVLLDTEGLGDVEKGDKNNDNWIFSLSILLSSTFIYNSRGTIDQHALEDLHFVTQLTQCIKVESGAEAETGEEFVRFFPTFVWAVRDFTLDLEINGEEVSADDYLEHALILKPDSSRQPSHYNEPRKCIRDYFSSRKCFVFVSPTTRKNMKTLEQMSDQNLDQEFVEETNRFCQYVYDNVKAKMVPPGTDLTGAMLAALLEIYVDSLHSGNIPCLDNAVTSLAKIENSKALADAVKYFQEMMEKTMKFPSETVEELSNIYCQHEKEAITIFMKRSFHDEDQKYQREMEDTIKTLYQKYCQQNEKASEDKCRALLDSLQEPIADRLKNGQYAKPGGYNLYAADQQMLECMYSQAPGKGIKSDFILKEFMKEKQNESQSILQLDKSLTKKEKEIKAERERRALAEQELKAQEQQMAAMEQQKQAMEQSHKEYIKEFDKKMADDREKAQAEQERILAHRLAEQERSIREGYQQMQPQLRVIPMCNIS